MATYSRQEWYGELEADPGPPEGEEALALATEDARQSLFLAFLTALLLLPLSAAFAYGINHVENRGLFGVADSPLQPWLAPAAFILIGSMMGIGIRLTGRGRNRLFAVMAVFFTLACTYLTVVLQRAFGLHDLTADFLNGTAAGQLGTIAAIKLSFLRIGPLDWLANQGIREWVAVVLALLASWMLSYKKGN